MSLLLVSLAFAAGPGNMSDNAGANATTNQTQNIIQNQTQTRLRDGTHMMEGGQQLRVQEHMGEMQLQASNMVANTKMQMNQEMTGNTTQLKTQLSNGRNAEIKVMPDVAAEKALERLRLRNCNEEEGCQIELKEMNKDGEPIPGYQVKTQRESRVLGLFKAKMQVQANIDAENGQVLGVNKPWWAFLATEPSELDAE